METYSPTKNVTHSEILTQTNAWQEALEVVARYREQLVKLSQDSFNRVIFTGCGSTYYLAISAASLFQELTGLIATGVPASELWLYPENNYDKKSRTLLIAISRSGETTETLAAVSEFIKRKDGLVITVTNHGEKSLAKMGMMNLIIESGKEISIAQTRAFTSMYVCITALATIFSGRDDLFNEMNRLPSTGSDLIKEYEPLAKQIGEDLSLDRFYFLGSGPRYGLACEANLKMKEMSLTHSEPFHFLEFRHGPKSMANSTTGLVAFLSGSRRPMEEKVLLEMRPFGVRQLTIANSKADIIFPSTLSEPITNILYLPIIQLMAFYRSLEKGLDPDRPKHLDAIVRLDER